MDKFKDLEELFPRPKGYDGECNGEPAGDDIAKQLTDDTVSEAYKVPWKAYGHLKDATEDVVNSVWGMGDGRKTLSQKDIPEIGKK
jgi:hypothetical protein